MRHPPPMTWLIGNPVSALLILGGCAWWGWQWWTRSETISGWVPVIAGFIAMTVLNASSRLSRYKRWKRDWDATGAPIGKERRARSRPLGWLKIAFAVMIWGLMATQVPKLQTQHPLAVASFWAGSALLLPALAYRRYRRGASTKPPARSQPVSIALPIPGSSPDFAAMVRALPDSWTALLTAPQRKA